MKKYVFLSVVILAIMAGYTINASNPGNSIPFALIHYQVNVANHLPPGQTACPSLVMVTDGNGSAVNGSQPYDPSISTYHFYEMGPVTGTREAVIFNVPQNSDLLCPFTPQPQARKTTFYNGQTYRYSMIYGPRPPSPVPLPPAGQ